MQQLKKQINKIIKDYAFNKTAQSLQELLIFKSLTLCLFVHALFLNNAIF